jgi:hypothetical protein
VTRLNSASVPLLVIQKDMDLYAKLAWARAQARFRPWLGRLGQIQPSTIHEFFFFFFFQS